MSYDWLAALSLVKILAAFAFFFIYLPTKIFPQRPAATADERFFENLVVMAATGLIFAHLLALLQIYSIFTVLLCYFLLYTARVWYREKTFPLELLRSFVVRKTVLTLDVLDRVVDLKASARNAAKRKWNAWKEKTGDRRAVTHVLLFAAILIYASALRYADVFRSAAFGYSDSYSHLLWMKSLESGVLYPVWDRNQYYPKGFHSFAAILHGLSGLDGAMALRLVGPLVGTLLVVAVYYAGKKLTRSSDAALIGMFIYGTFIDPIVFLNNHFENGVLATTGTSRWFVRQMTPLAEEFALVFLMPAFFAAYSYITERDRRSFMIFGFATITLFLTHPLVAAAFGMALGILVILSFLLRILSWQVFKNLTVAGFVTAVLGNLQLIYGALFDRSVKAAVEDYQVGWLGDFEKAGGLPYTLEIMLSAGLGLLFFVGGILWAKEERKLLWAAFGLYALVLVFLGLSMNFGIRYILSPDRVEHYRIFLLASAATGLYSVITLFPILREWYRRKRIVYQYVTGLFLVGLGILGYPTELPAPPRFEYEALATLSYRIKRSFPPLEWTVVSTTEDYSKVFKDRGWHMNLVELLERYDPYEADLEMPTPYTFLFVEKNMFHRSSDPSLNRPGVRLNLERRLQEWSSIYHMFHDDMSIYYEDWDIIVYLINQTELPNTATAAEAKDHADDIATAVGRGVRRLWSRSGS